MRVEGFRESGRIGYGEVVCISEGLIVHKSLPIEGDGGPAIIAFGNLRVGCRHGPRPVL